MPQPFSGAQWVRAPGVPPVLLISAELTDTGRWLFSYSTDPGQVVTITTMPAPGMLEPTDPAYALVVNDLIRSTP